MDKLTPERRSENMRRIRSIDTAPEKHFRRLIYALGYRYRLYGKALPGKPDLVFAGRRKVIFIHGCFWHQHEGCIDGHTPKSGLGYWLPKLERNKVRDAENRRQLKNLGWKHLVIWECELKSPTRLVRRVQKFLGPPERAIPSTPASRASRAARIASSAV